MFARICDFELQRAPSRAEWLLPLLMQLQHDPVSNVRDMAQRALQHVEQ